LQFVRNFEFLKWLVVTGKLAPWEVSWRRDEWNVLCVFRPKGKCYDDGMNVFVALRMESCHESNVERAMCKQRGGFDWGEYRRP